MEAHKLALFVALLLASAASRAAGQDEAVSSEPESSSASPVTFPTSPLSPDIVSLTATPVPAPEAAAEVPDEAPGPDGEQGEDGGPSGTTTITTSSTKIDATTVVLYTSSSTTAPGSSGTSPAEPEIHSTTEEAREDTVMATTSARPTVDTGWRTTSTTTRAPARTRPPPDVSGGTQQDQTGASCDFGLYPSTTLCGWRSLHAGRSPSSPRWRPGSGMATNWIGGPRSDFEGAVREPPPLGGYAFVETSEGAGVARAGDRAFLMSPPLPASGVQGSCLSFMYSLAGLSARGLRVLLATNSSSRTSLRELWRTPPPHAPGDGWMPGRLLYTEARPHQLLLEASCSPALDASRTYRGHVAVDAVSLVPGESCPEPLACTFAAGFCRWSNVPGDDFDWTMGRGSGSTVTGPAAPADTWVEPMHGALPKQHFKVSVQGSGRDLPDDEASEGFDGLEGLEGAVEAQDGVDVEGGDLRLHPGGYVYIDSAYPRRPGDSARLQSELLPATDPMFPSCLRFWFHMYGVDVGSLRWLLVPESSGSSGSSPERVVWSMTGDAGNAWFRGAVTLAEPRPFRVVVEATVGAVGMSDIAVDNVSLDPGPCPVSPQVAGALEQLSRPPSSPAAGTPSLGARSRAPRMPPDCSLEVDECGWRGAAAGQGRNQAALWERLGVASLPPTLQRRPHGPGVGLRNDFFMGLQMSAASSAPTSASTQLVSLPITSEGDPLCLAFWYLVHEPARDGGMSTVLGALRVRVDEVLDGSSPPPGAPPLAPPPPPRSAVVWALYNTQAPAWRPARVPLPANWTFTVTLEGEWGPGRHSGVLAVDDIVLYHSKCPVTPASALSSPADCSFSRDTCSWSNGSWPSSGSWPTWQHAGSHHRPARLSDNTFHAPGGYVFFDMFSLAKMPRRARLGSAVLDAGDPVCFSFWFAAFGQGESTRLRVIRVDQDRRLPEVVVWQLSARGMDTARPHWMAAQAALSAAADFSIVLEGEASNGGFAVDDVRVRPGTCQTRPVGAST